MSSSAISAQGSSLEIATGAGSAITITAISQAFRAEVTGTHALSVGDRVTFASVVGMTQINSLVGNVIAVTGTTKFVVDIDSRAFTAYGSAGTATPVAFTEVKEIKTFSGFDGSSAEIDVTTLDSTAKEFRLGLQDFGGFKCDINVVNTDPGQIACTAAKASGDVKVFKLILPNAEVATFSGMVKAMPVSGGVDGIFSGSLDIRVTGTVSWA